MNLIGNNCLSCRIYQAANMKFNNPFCWCIVENDDLLNLIKNFNNIDLNNVVFSLHKSKENENYYVKCLIDNIVNVHFVHYLQNDKFIEPQVNEIDVYYKDIISWVKEKWYDRVKRIKNKNDITFFASGIYNFGTTSDNVVSLVKKLNELGKNSNIILFCDKQYITNDLKNLKIIEYNDEMKEAHNNKNDKLVGELIYKELQVKYPELINE